MRPVLIGESNPYGGPGSNALLARPAGCSGDRLRRLVLCVDVEEYYERFERVNLCRGKWRLVGSAGVGARASAAALMRGEMVPPWFRGPVDQRAPFVLCGAKVASAFMLPFRPFTQARAVLHECSRDVVLLPHPSGLSRAWNEPGAFARARDVLRSAGVL